MGDISLENWVQGRFFRYPVIFTKNRMWCTFEVDPNLCYIFATYILNFVGYWLILFTVSFYIRNTSGIAIWFSDGL